MPICGMIFTSSAALRSDIEEAYLGKELEGHRLAFVEVGVGDYRHQGLEGLQQRSWTQHGILLFPVSYLTCFTLEALCRQANCF